MAKRIASLIAAGALVALSPTPSPALTLGSPPPVTDLAGNWDGNWSGNGITADFTMTIADTTFGSFSGAFDWSCTSGISCSGIENFSGSWNDPTTFSFSSQAPFGSVDPAAVNIGPATYLGSVGSLDTVIAGTDSSGGTWSATQVPEPGTLGLLGLGLVSAGILRKRKAT